ncbi:MAG: DEAD/DEAH box helicase [Rikenellaceae bacterium]
MDKTTTFKDLGIDEPLILKLAEMNIIEPLPIQQLVLPEALCGKSLLVGSQTGSGKTLAYLLPILQLLNGCENRGARALILVPTRELAQQIGVVCSAIIGATNLTHSVIVGGVEYESQRLSMLNSPDIVIATSGRLLDLLEQGVAEINDLDYFILDEVDQMLDLGFKEPIMQLSTLCGVDAQILCFSATLPKDVIDIVESISPSVMRLSIEGQSISVASVEHLGYYVSFGMMDHLLLHLIRSEAAEQSIIFTRSRKMADRVVGVLQENNISAEAMHSDRSQAAREYILERFRQRETTIIVATDVIARGIDIESVTHVFNFGLPQSAEQYIHRCGRCGRVGRKGRAISLFTPEERPMVDAICRLMRRHIVIDNNHPYITTDVTLALSPSTKAKGRRRR